MLPLCPMKKTRKSCAILPLDSAMRSCVSKYARNTYGLQLNLGLSAFLTSALIFLVGRNFFPVLFPRYVLCVILGAITGESGPRSSPLANLSLRYATSFLVPFSVRNVQYWCLAFDSVLLTTI